jgi:hypothetical protein
MSMSRPNSKRCMPSPLVGAGLILTLYLQIGLGYSPLKAGLTTLPQSLGTVAGFIAAGSGLSEKLGRKLLLIGTATMMVAPRASRSRCGRRRGAFGIAVLGTIVVWLLPGAVVHAGSAQVDTAIAEYAQTAVRAGFIDTTVRTLGVAFLLLLLALATASLLPRKAHPEAWAMRPSRGGGGR